MYWVLLGVFCLGTVLLLSIFGIKRGWRMAAGLLLAEYAVILYSSTVVFRQVVAERFFKHEYLIPFWSYHAFLVDGKMRFLTGNIMNIVVFIPVGLLLGMAFKNIKPRVVLLTGVLISLSIEILQFATKRGFAEFDDLMHNTLGCMLGFGLYCLLKLIFKKRQI